MEEKKKKCIKCGEEKLLNEFTKNKNCREGYQNTCKKCRQQQQKAWRETHKKPSRPKESKIVEKEPAKEQPKSEKQVLEPSTPQSALDRQVGGSHYKHYKIQPYEFFVMNQIPHHKSAIIRRILRYDHPTGHGREDLEKIKHEVDLIIEIERW